MGERRPRAAGRHDAFARGSRFPRFADPLEIWGEALVAKRSYGDAVQRFQQAGRFAPHWKRNRAALAAAERLRN